MSRRTPLPMVPLFPEFDRPAKPDFRALSPTSVCVSFSGEKDSFLALQEAIRLFGRELVFAHYQEIEEDWPGTKEYGAAVCSRLGIAFYTTKGVYHGYRCLDCGHTYLFADSTKASCQTVPKSLEKYFTGFMGLPAGSMGSRSLIGDHALSMLFQFQALWICIKGK